MSRILIHSNAPWIPTGYGTQTRHLVRALKSLGHEVAVSAFAGLNGAELTWEDTLVMPHGQYAFGVDVLLGHIDRYQPDLVITLMDLWKLEAIAPALVQRRVAAWLPIDCTPLSRRDRAVLINSQVHPIAMSTFGLAQIQNDLDAMGPVYREPRYVPHMIDLQGEYYPMPDRDAYRAELELADKFVVGLVAANRDAVRKAFPEQFHAFARFRENRPDAVLLLHTTMQSTSGLDLMTLAQDMGIMEHVRFTDQYAQDTGLFSTTMMRRWYNACDVVMLCSYGEGFGLPAVEAQACGTPVVASRNSALTELVDVRNRVATDPFWNHVHRAWWGRPRPEDIVKRLSSVAGRLATDQAHVRRTARTAVARFDLPEVTGLWKAVVEETCAS